MASRPPRHAFNYAYPHGWPHHVPSEDIVRFPEHYLPSGTSHGRPAMRDSGSGWNEIITMSNSELQQPSVHTSPMSTDGWALHLSFFEHSSSSARSTAGIHSNEDDNEEEWRPENGDLPRGGTALHSSENSRYCTSIPSTWNFTWTDSSGVENNVRPRFQRYSTVSGSIRSESRNAVPGEEPVSDPRCKKEVSRSVLYEAPLCASETPTWISDSSKVAPRVHGSGADRRASSLDPNKNILSTLPALHPHGPQDVPDRKGYQCRHGVSTNWEDILQPRNSVSSELAFKSPNPAKNGDPLYYGRNGRPERKIEADCSECSKQSTTDRRKRPVSNATHSAVVSATKTSSLVTPAHNPHDPSSDASLPRDEAAEYNNLSQKFDDPVNHPKPNSKSKTPAVSQSIKLEHPRSDSDDERELTAPERPCQRERSWTEHNLRPGLIGFLKDAYQCRGGHARFNKDTSDRHALLLRADKLFNSGLSGWACKTPMLGLSKTKRAIVQEEICRVAAQLQHMSYARAAVDHWLANDQTIDGRNRRVSGHIDRRDS